MAGWRHAEFLGARAGCAFRFHGNIPQPLRYAQSWFLHTRQFPTGIIFLQETSKISFIKDKRHLYRGETSCIAEKPGGWTKIDHCVRIAGFG